MTQKLIAPSILSADFGKLTEEIQAVERAGADIIHVDVMDGHFVPNITIGPLVVKAADKSTKLPLDVHLMIQNPQNYIKDFIQAGADWVSVHVEEGCHLDRTINMIKENGAKAGVAFNPGTPVEAIKPVIGITDFIVIMTVNPGFGGQGFVPYCMDKIRIVRDMTDKHNPACLIQVDGGVKTSNIKGISDAGADVFVSGSGVFHTDNYEKTIKEMKSLIES